MNVVTSGLVFFLFFQKKAGDCVRVRFETHTTAWPSLSLGRQQDVVLAHCSNTRDSMHPPLLFASSALPPPPTRTSLLVPTAQNQKTTSLSDLVQLHPSIWSLTPIDSRPMWLQAKRKPAAKAETYGRVDATLVCNGQVRDRVRCFSCSPPVAIPRGSDRTGSKPSTEICTPYSLLRSISDGLASQEVPDS